VSSPWLGIPLADYEAHMALPSVGQAELLAATLEQAVTHLRPRSLLVAGVAGGNGLERVDPAIVDRVLALDIQPAFLAECGRRHGSRFRAFDAVIHDLDRGWPALEPVDLVMAGLVLEYVDVERFCAGLPAVLQPGGHLVVLLQRPAAHLPEVSPSPYRCLESLATAFRFVDPGDLHMRLERTGLTRLWHDQIRLPSGKEFHRACWRRIAGPTTPTDHGGEGCP
jgi:SAM-dependent methyltransferase